MGLGQLMIVGGNTVTLLDKLKGGMGKNAVAIGGLKSALGLLASPVGIGAVIVAIGGLIAMIGDNENALLKLQEKFGGFGTVIGGVCEFVSGHVQLTFGNLAIAIMGVFDIIGAIIDGPGGATVNDAFDKMTAKMKLNTEEAMGKMVLTTTRGMSQLRNATDTQLNGTVESMNTIMDAIPRIVDGKYRTASQVLGQQLHNMDFTQLSILQGMNDTTKMMFQGIVQGMSVEQASKKVEQNLKEMAAAGKIDADTMQKDISQAMEQMKQQMDTKTKEGADKVNTNTKNAENQAVQNAKNTKDKVSKEYNETASNIDKSTKDAGNKAKANMDKALKMLGMPLIIWLMNLKKELENLHLIQMLI
ncbi:phage tail tape measure, family, core region domain protein [[Clostridium] sordellii ATCC 9714]|nr:phage tail tape measure, family, core region domain protein [[Clostridium] sordellii ATCC 9714] [Paeniclostridium sordellii ATCC 9714]